MKQNPLFHNHFGRYIWKNYVVYWLDFQFFSFLILQKQIIAVFKSTRSYRKGLRTNLEDQSMKFYTPVTVGTGLERNQSMLTLTLSLIQLPVLRINLTNTIKLFPKGGIRSIIGIIPTNNNTERRVDNSWTNPSFPSKVRPAVAKLSGSLLQRCI